MLRELLPIFLAKPDRVSQGFIETRNPLFGSPDAWEQKILSDFAIRLEKENPENIEFAESVTEPQGQFMRYMKAITMQDVYLKCHGSLETIAPQVKEQINAEYPHDKSHWLLINQYVVHSQ